MAALGRDMACKLRNNRKRNLWAMFPRFTGGIKNYIVKKTFWQNEVGVGELQQYKTRRSFHTKEKDIENLNHTTRMNTLLILSFCKIH